MNIGKVDPPEDQREISLNETSLKRPLDVVDVIGGHGPWQFRQWVVFFVASLCNSMVLFSALFLPSQTFCFLSNSTVPPEALSSPVNSTSLLMEASNYVGGNSSHLPQYNCSSTGCGNLTNDSELDVSRILYHTECSNSLVEIFAKCVYVVSFAISGILVYFTTQRFGRRPVSVVSCLLLIASVVGTSWANAPVVFLNLRFIVALGVSNIYLISVFTLMEYVHKDYKLLYFLTGHLGWGLAHFLLPLVSWLAEDWMCFNLATGIVAVLLSLSVWWSPESPSSFPSRCRHQSKSKRSLKYAAFTNGYSTTDVDQLPQGFHLRQDKTLDIGTPSSPKQKVLWTLYSCILFMMSFNTTFLYFASKWHTEWFKVPAGRVSFSFLGSTEVAGTIILLFLTCLVAIKFLWASVTLMTSVLMVVIHSRNKPGSSTSSTMLYTMTVFFTAAAWTLLLAKSFCHRIAGTTARFNLFILGVATVAGALAASAVVFKASEQDLLLAFGVPHIIVSVSSLFVPDEFFGIIA